MTICQPLPGDTLRKFWTYAPGSCGQSQDPCGASCGSPGFSLSLNSSGEGVLSTAGRAASIAILILMTRAAIADGSPCQRLPQNRAGFWADSFRADGRKSGSQIYHIPTSAPVSQVVALLKAYAEDDLQKMVAMGEAESVTVDARYGGAGTVRLVVKIMVDGQNIDVPFAASGDGGTWKIGPA